MRSSKRINNSSKSTSKKNYSYERLSFATCNGENLSPIVVFGTNGRFAADSHTDRQTDRHIQFHAYTFCPKNGNFSAAKRRHLLLVVLKRERKKVGKGKKGKKVVPTVWHLNTYETREITKKREK